MLSLSLLRSVRRSRWRTRLAIAAIAAGVLSGPLGAAPAGAHGTAPHYVTLSGWVETLEQGGNGNPISRCRNTYVSTLTLQRPKKTEGRTEVIKWCDGQKASVVLIARLGDENDKYVYVDGTIQLKASDCGICPWEIDKKDFHTFIPEDFTQTLPKPQWLGAAGITSEFSFKIIVDGPDDPVM